MAGLVMLFACMMAATGTPCCRAIISSVSLGATVIGVPPSQVQVGGGGAAGSEPVISLFPGWYDPMPRPPPELPSGSLLARCGMDRLSTRLVEVPCGIDPVVSLRDELLEAKISEKRPESPLQLAAPSPINEMATNCGQTADRRDAHMMTRPHAKNTSERINNVAVNRPLSTAAENLI